MSLPQVTIVGGGLAGCEAALYLTDRGLPVRLLEQKPGARSPAHRLDGLAELVCSNSLKSLAPDTASGLFKAELEALGSRLLPLARDCALPAGNALAVDPERFSARVGEVCAKQPGLEVLREEQLQLPSVLPCIMATGPLTSPALSEAIESHFGSKRLSFYDAIAPTVTRDSLAEAELFAASRYDKGEPDYLNAPMDRASYEAMCRALAEAEAYPAHDFEAEVPYFESCLPAEVLASRGIDTLRFGPLRPVGLVDPRDGRRPWAVLQLRRENGSGTLWGLVGCQTKLRHGEQDRIFRLVPALAEADFVRYGSMHRNFFLDYPTTLTPFQESRRGPGLYFAGQMTGVEGYVESMGSGLLAARHLERRLRGQKAELPPAETMVGSLARFLADQAPGRAQPMNVSFGLLPPLAPVPGVRKLPKAERRQALARRSLESLAAWLGER